MRRTKGRKYKSQKGISNTVHRRFGYLQFEKGSQEVVLKDGSSKKSAVVMWDLVENCTREKCKMYGICQYVKKIEAENGKRCVAQNHYLRAVYRAIIKKIGDKMEETDYLRMGLELMPLYNMLFKMKFYEFSMHDVVHETPKTIKPNPVFKEIRETILTIEKIWRALGSRKSAPEAKKVGEDSFYEALVGTTPEEESQTGSDEEKGTGVDFGEVEKKPKKRDLRERKDKRRRKRGWGWDAGVHKESKSEKHVIPYTRRKEMTQEEYEQNLPVHRKRDIKKPRETNAQYKRRKAREQRRRTT